MVEQFESSMLGMEQWQEELNSKMNKLLDLMMDKGKTVPPQNVKEESDLAYPPGFTPLHGQTSTQPPMAAENPPLNNALFIPTAPTLRVLAVGMPLIMMIDIGVDRIKTEHRCDILEERLRAIEGSNSFGTIDPTNPYLVPKVTLPPKFKMPDFEKYDGTRCPRAHLRLYCQAMTAYSNDEKLMMHCFQISLTGFAIRLYIQQNKAWVRTWKDLANAFITHYCHVTEMAPSCMMLQEMEKKPIETFREYAYKWRDMTIHMDPPMSDR
ncbi:uncharacterized protein LOC131160751 [Malania oleifera]|uniref:uncharacterized protein LOC131160751 n=1 Tax=Malania oleifera TaxID=397392 RepID=UPI0025AE8134|nr:uncharacterized protein LOC131160751 [Malania oleifera]